MTLKRGLLILAAIAVGGSAPSVAADIPVNDPGGLRVDGRTQMFGFAQHVDDASRNDARLYLFLKQARLNFSGGTETTSYHVELAYAGEDEVRAPSPGVSLNLLDFNFDIQLPGTEATAVRLGQFKVPYGREGLTNSGTLQFAGRSIQHLGFRMGRDVGAAVSTQRGALSLVGGMFAGGGRDVPERYLPQTLGIPLVALRVG
jgi:phosphate-selective porin